MQTAIEIGASAPPLVLGRYELLGKLGTGGMASVYLARHAGEAGFQRLCAIKVLHPHLTEDAGFISMLLDEARIAARLHHPNVVPIIDLGTQGSTLYVAMDYIEGCSLSALLKRHRDVRPARLLVPLVLDMLAGLHQAHTCTDDDGTPLDLVHRDVSPQNVLVGVDGTARITDFGIARAGSRITSTKPGQLKGKLAYMSPEQIRSKPIDRRADVFSTGAMLWSMLTGRKLFVGDNDGATMSNILSLEIPPPSTVGLLPPAALDAVCLRALERDPDKRFATAQDMEEALRDAASGIQQLGSRREIADWIGASFRDELAERRKAIRVAVPPAIGRGTIEFPSFTPSHAGHETPISTRLQVAVAAPPPARRGRRWAIAGALAAIVLGVSVALAIGMTDPAPVVVQRASPAVASPPPPAPPILAPAIVAPPIVAPPPPPRPPAPPPASAHVAPPRPRPKVAAPPPAVAPTPAPAPPPVQPPTRWDSDSPTPPP